MEGGTGKYLGLPECFSGSKRELLSYITDRLKSRLTGWYAKTVSLGGKEVLLKAVAMALPVYAMSCFRLTKHQCQKLTSAMTSFWWNSCEEQKKMHWVSWEKMCKSKQEGGLGFRDIGDFNQALLAKQAWRLMVEPNSLLARVYKAKYFPGKDFIDSVVGQRPSYAWRSILHGRELLAKGLIKSIGNGKNTKVWIDNWVFDEEPRRPYNKQTFIDLNLTVSTLITPQGSWNQGLISEMFFPDDVIRVMSFPPILSERDRHIWAYNHNDIYTVKSGSWLITQLKEKTNRMANPLPLQEQELNKLKAKVWELQTLPKIKMFLWRALSGALAVSDCLRKHGLNTMPQCVVCNDNLETINHVLFLCWPARKVWEIANVPAPQQGFSAALPDNITYVMQLMRSTGIANNVQAAVPWLLWGIWKYRNELVYADTQGDLDHVVEHALSESAIWLNLNAPQPSSVMSNTLPARVSKHWSRPPSDVIKCNVHSSWINATHMCGGAWIARNHHGDAIFHARDAFLPSSNRIAAELRCVIWTMQSLSDLRIETVEIWSDCNAAMEAISDPLNWPRYHSFLSRIHRLSAHFRKVSFKTSSPKANHIARKIASSVTRDGRLRSYLARGGPAWLHTLIDEDKRGSGL